MARYIFITGGVVSSLGKGLASAALGALLQARGYSVRLRKLDPYLNVDPGTMSPRTGVREKDITLAVSRKLADELRLIMSSLSERPS